MRLVSCFCPDFNWANGGTRGTAVRYTSVFEWGIEVGMNSYDHIHSKDGVVRDARSLHMMEVCSDAGQHQLAILPPGGCYSNGLPQAG